MARFTLGGSSPGHSCSSLQRVGTAPPLVGLPATKTLAYASAAGERSGMNPFPEQGFASTYRHEHQSALRFLSRVITIERWVDEAI
jgi:hypothetical protein